MWFCLAHIETDSWQPELRVLLIWNVNVKSSFLENERYTLVRLKIFVIWFGHGISNFTKNHTFDVLNLIYRYKINYISFCAPLWVYSNWLPTLNIYDPTTTAKISHRLHHLNNVSYRYIDRSSKALWAKNLTKIYIVQLMFVVFCHFQDVFVKKSRGEVLWVLCLLFWLGNTGWAFTVNW